VTDIFNSEQKRCHLASRNFRYFFHYESRPTVWAQYSCIVPQYSFREECPRNGPERKHFWEDLGVDGRKILKMDFREVGLEGVDWIHLAQDRNRWRALANTVMNLLAP
jgi:hypothetical protein